MSSRPWYFWLFDLLAGSLTKENLARAGAGTEALGVAVTAQLALSSGYDAEAWETRTRDLILTFAEMYVTPAPEMAEHCYHGAGLDMPAEVGLQFALCRPVKTPKPADLGFSPTDRGIAAVIYTAGEVPPGLTWRRHPEFARSLADQC